jgi:hypothetical protein
MYHMEILVKFYEFKKMLHTLMIDLRHTEAIVSPNSTDLLCLRVTQVPRSQYIMVIFVLTKTTTTCNNTINYFTPCTCTWGNYHIQELDCSPFGTHPIQEFIFILLHNISSYRISELNFELFCIAFARI